MKTILLFFLRGLSKKIIRKYHPDVVGITGSVGKTSSKEAIYLVLASRFSVRRNYKNYNNEIGLPLAVIGIEQSPGRSLLGWLKIFGKAIGLLLKRDKNYPEILVLEMGADKPGDIKYLTDIAPCKVGVLTFISHAHTEFFKTLKKIAQEKRVIISHLPEDGFAILNADCPLVLENRDKTKAEVITYGFENTAQLKASDVNMITDEKTGRLLGLNFKVSYKGNIVPVFLPGAITNTLISSALSGMAVGIALGVNLVEAAQALRNLSPLAGHMRLIDGIKNTMIIDDTYNSSPEAVKAALQTLSLIAVKTGSERFAVLGDMLELGAETENTHREIGLRVAELGINYLITVGEASKHTAHAAIEAGMDEHRVAMFADSVAAGRFLQDKLEDGDVVLVKGSQGVRMEKIVKEVMAEPLQAVELLVRQSGEWVKK